MWLETGFLDEKEHNCKIAHILKISGAVFFWRECFQLEIILLPSCDSGKLQDFCRLKEDFHLWDLVGLCISTTQLGIGCTLTSN